VSAVLHPPVGFFEVAETLEARGHEAWAVGGAVRDAVLGHERADWDLATDARPDAVRRIFRRTVPLGVEHGTVGVLASDGGMYEVTTFRRDIATDGRHAVVEFADTIDEDLGRRDFTINALAWRPATGELRDPFDGRGDLQSGLLRAVGDPVRRFAEDSLRTLRGLRFAGRFGLEIDAATRLALREATGRLGRLSAERVREELFKVFACDHPSAALRLYGEFGALTIWYPEMVPIASAGPSWELALGAVDAIPSHRGLLRLVAWCMPLVDTTGAAARSRECARPDEPDEDDEDIGAAPETMMRRLKFSGADLGRALHLLRCSRRELSVTDSAAAIREWLAEVGAAYARDLFRLRFAAARARGAAEGERELAFVWRRVHEEWLTHPPLTLSDLTVGGNDMLALGASEGPAIGLLLEELHARVLEDPELNRREALLEVAADLIELGHLGDSR